MAARAQLTPLKNDSHEKIKQINNIMDEKKSIIKSSECNNSFTQSSNMSISPSEEFFDITIYNNNSMNSWLNFDDNMFGFLTVGVNENE